MKTKLKQVTILTLLVVLVTLTGVVNAETVVQMQLTSSSKLEAGATVEVTLAITNINAGEGIDSFIGEISYDEEVFEPVTEDSFDGQNHWNLFTYNEETKLFTLSRSSYVNNNSDVLKVTLKVKEGVTKQSAEVSIKDIFVSGGTEDIEVNMVSVTIEVPQPTKPTPEEPDANTEEPGNNTETPGSNTEKPGNNTETPAPSTNTQNPTTEAPKTNTQKPTGNGSVQTNTDKTQPITQQDNSKSSGKIPQTGVAEDIIFFTIFVAMVIGVVSYIRYRSVSRDIK